MQKYGEVIRWFKRVKYILFKSLQCGKFIKYQDGIKHQLLPFVNFAMQVYIGIVNEFKVFIKYGFTIAQNQLFRI